MRKPIQRSLVMLDHSVMKQESDTEKAPIDLSVASDTKNPPSIDFSSILNGLTGFFC